MAKAIMIQGTMSNVGKSVVAAGLCRIFLQDGYRVAPFKSQNMALNSFITKEGLEMGRAQVMQAEAAGVEPVVAMNPILLKPTNDVGSQVIVNGEVLGTMSARDYFKQKKSLIPDIMRAYEALDREYDIIVIEGAGSPAEINLKQDDIVNMGMAKLAKAPVLLVGDIDRGGVFAQLYGTCELLDPDERALIKGLVINKFRGDKSILDPGVEMLEKLTGIPVVGVTPYLHVSLEDEDSLSERLEGKPQTSGLASGGTFTDVDEDTGPCEKQEEHTSVPLIDLAVIRFPRISNFTDFNIFESIEGVSVRYVSSVHQLGRPDLIFLPGTKNTMRDLLWMRQNGLEAAILKAQQDGTVIFGICGGYQMLGRTITDAEGVEEGGTVRGMGLLDMDTAFESEKARTRVEGRFLAPGGVLKELAGVSFYGYEIHMGRSHPAESMETAAALHVCTEQDITSRIQNQPEREGTAQTKTQPERAGAAQTETQPGPDKAARTAPLTAIRDSITGEEKQEGAWRENVYGTYVHGIFDSEEVAGTIVHALAAAKGISEGMGKSMDFAAFKETQYDLLADGLRANLDMDAIYRILEEGGL
ncbi:MAG: cobyric acid synthase [Lachnospiraceae bacterium]|nr:cobyric acid synthase [Lachnospiraceae bacterium]